MQEIMLYHKTDFQVHSLHWGVLWSRVGCQCRCSKTCCGYPASLHTNQTPCWQPLIFSISENSLSFLSCTPAYLQLLIYRQRSSCWLSHTSSSRTFWVNTQGIPPFLCTDYSVFMSHRAENIWVPQLHQLAKTGKRQYHYCCRQGYSPLQGENVRVMRKLWLVHLHHLKVRFCLFPSQCSFCWEDFRKRSVLHFM